MSHIRQRAIFAATTATLLAGGRRLTGADHRHHAAADARPIRVTTAPVQLTPAQRYTVYRAIVREKVASAQATVVYRAGTRIPASAQLYAARDEVAVEVPAIINTGEGAKKTAARSVF